MTDKPQPVLINELISAICEHLGFAR